MNTRCYRNTAKSGTLETASSPAALKRQIGEVMGLRLCPSIGLRSHDPTSNIAVVLAAVS